MFPFPPEVVLGLWIPLAGVVLALCMESDQKDDQ